MKIMRIEIQFNFKTIMIFTMIFATLFTFYVYQNDKYRQQRIQTIQPIMVKTLPSVSRLSTTETIVTEGTIFFLISDYSIEFHRKDTIIFRIL